MQNGKTVIVYVAVVKDINGRRYLDALKGFLIDKKNRKTPLENPCMIKLNSTNANILPDGYYE